MADREENHACRDRWISLFIPLPRLLLTSAVPSLDVTHPGPTSIEGSPSLVAVVASVGDNLVHFPATLGLQRNKQLRKNSEEVWLPLSKIPISHTPS